MPEMLEVLLVTTLPGYDTPWLRGVNTTSLEFGLKLVGHA